MESESSFRNVLVCRNIGSHDARISLQVQSCTVRKPPMSLRKKGIYYHILTIPECCLLSSFRNVAWSFCSLLSCENGSQTLWMEESFQATWANSTMTLETSILSGEYEWPEEIRPRNIMATNYWVFFSNLAIMNPNKILLVLVDRMFSRSQ